VPACGADPGCDDNFSAHKADRREVVAGAIVFITRLFKPAPGVLSTVSYFFVPLLGEENPSPGSRIDVRVGAGIWLRYAKPAIVGCNFLHTQSFRKRAVGAFHTASRLPASYRRIEKGGSRVS
jgi:hypothetical protein